jgi:hypothetical protein
MREAPGSAPAAALPALEATLLALETADGRALASQVQPAHRLSAVEGQAA